MFPIQRFYPLFSEKFTMAFLEYTDDLGSVIHSLKRQNLINEPLPDIGHRLWSGVQSVKQILRRVC